MKLTTLDIEKMEQRIAPGGLDCGLPIGAIGVGAVGGAGAGAGAGGGAGGSASGSGSGSGSGSHSKGSNCN